MPRGFHNWNAGQVMKFLKANKFKNTHQRGSHFYYSKKNFLVVVPVHSSASIHPKTMKSIVKQSGIPFSEWHI
jgi:predicted RNA binding protein YcfA (HicA-like mRNA interferase family)